MTVRRAHRPKKVLIVLVIVLVAGVGVAALNLGPLERRAASPKSSASVPSTPAKTPATQPAQPAAFDKTRYSTTDPASLWVVVNKSHPLSPIDYAPSDIVTAYGKPVSGRMKADLDALMADGAKAGLGLTLASGYRSYAYQTNLYASYVAADGTDKADTYSARPGYSEHQTGLAVDFGDKAGVCIVEDCYADTPEGKWLAANAHTYGFLLRYTADQQSVTGYQAEAWHYRYVGRELTAEMHAQKIPTLEQFFGVSGGTSY